MSAPTAQPDARLKEALLESLAVSRGGASVRTAALAASTLPVMALMGMPQLLVWLAAMLVWDRALVRWLELHWVLPLVDTDLRRARLRRGAMVLFGFTLTQILPLAAWSTGGAFGAVVGGAWVMYAAMQAFIYYSRDRWLLAAGMIPIAACVLVGPTLGFGFGWESAVISMFMLVALASGAAFVGRSDTLIAKAGEEATARRAAEAASFAKSRFIANMHHELRTPLNAIIGYTEMMREDALAQQREDDVADLERVLAAARLQLMMMSDLLAFSALQDQRADVAVREFDPVRLARETGEAMRAGVEVNGNDFVVEVADDLGGASGDPEKLRHCLEHLISNAGKFTRNGVVTLSARRGGSENGDCLLFMVRDTGVGIDAERQAQIFEPFTQADDSETRGFGGAGIGLAITARLARLMGGAVSVDSAPGLGSTFTLHVPARLGASATNRAPALASA